MAEVDVIIPVYNTPIEFVRQALGSVFEQTVGDWRAVVVNDGSSPESTRQLERLLSEANDPRLRYLKTENRGLAAARNLGIAESDSPFVALLDSDDMWYPRKLERQLEVMREGAAVPLIHGFSDLLIGDDIKGLRRVQPRDRGYNEMDQDEVIVRMLRGNFVAVNTVMLRRSVGQSIGFFDENMRSLEDKELWIRLLLAGHRFRDVPETFAIYRVHANNMSKDVVKMRGGRMKLICKIDGLVDGGPRWLRSRWPELRSEMVRNTQVEVAGSYLESGRYALALKHAMPWHSGGSRRAARVVLASILSLVGLRR